MSERNPYAPSKASLGDRPSGGTGRVTAWRDGNVVVMLAGGEIPHRCVKCNEPAEEPTKERTLYWYNPWLYLLVLISILVFAIVALIVRKKAVVSAGLCADHKRRRRNALTVAWIGVLAGTLLLLLGVTESSSAAALTGVPLMLIAIVVGITLGRVVYPVRIDNDYVRLKGCGEHFLATLPEFPY